MEQSREKKIFLESVQKMWQLEQWQLSCIAPCPPGRLVPHRRRNGTWATFLFLESICDITPTNPLPKEKAWKASSISGITAKLNDYPRAWAKRIMIATLAHCFFHLSSKDIPRILQWMWKRLFHHQLSNVDRVVECNSCTGSPLVVLVEAEETLERENATSARDAPVWRMGRWHPQTFIDTYRRCDTCGKKKQTELGWPSVLTAW